MSKKQNIMEDYIKSLIKDELNDQINILEATLKEEDAQKIVATIIPHLDKLISDRVKQHFIVLSELIKESFTFKEKI
jgi:hypothetical protein